MKLKDALGASSKWVLLLIFVFGLGMLIFSRFGLFQNQVNFFTYAPQSFQTQVNQKVVIPDSGVFQVDGLGTTPQELEVHATIESIGIVSPYLGDDNQSNTATAYYRPVGTQTWLQAHPLTSDRLASEWRGSLVNLNANTQFEIEVHYQDEDGVSPAIVSSTIWTRPDYPVIGSNGVIRVVSDQSNLMAVLASAQPGDTVQLLGGIYTGDIELDETNSGLPGAYITIEPAPGETVIFDGSDPAVNGPGDDWTFYTSTSKGDVYYIDLPWGETTCVNGSNMLPNYVGELIQGEGVRYLLFPSDTEDWNNDFLPAPVGKAYYVCDGTGPGPDGRLYVLTYGAQDPDNLTIYIGKGAWAFKLDGTDYIRIRNFEIRNFSTNGIFLDYHNNGGADYNIVENNTIHGIGKRHIRLKGKPGESWTVNNLIQNNVIFEHGYRDSQWQWEVEYHHGRGNANGIDLSDAAFGNVIRGNDITSGHDGIQVNDYSNDVDVYNNILRECMDNGIEVDNDPGQNIRIWGNTFYYCYSSLSLQDWNGIQHGPVYIFRNLVITGDDPQGRTDDLGGTTGYSSKNAFKMGSDISPDGYVYIYHNTISLERDELGQGDGIRDSGGNFFANAVTRNNIWHVTGDVIKLRTSDTIVNMDFDCDNLHDLDPTNNTFIVWSDSGGPQGDGDYTTLDEFQTYTGQETAGISDNSTLFSLSYTLLPGSPDIDSGCIITGFNDRPPHMFFGAAPDIGAFEYINLPLSIYLPVIIR